MNPKIEAKLSLLESTRLAMLKMLEGMDEQKLSASPAPRKWSISQIIYHLNQAESLSIIYVGKKMKDVNNLKTSGLLEKIKMLVVKIAFALPVKYKAPQVLGDMPQHVDYKEIVAKWNETRKNLRDLVTSLPEDMLSKNIFKQPAAGRLNVYQMLDFMQVHFNRHFVQVESIAK